MSGDSESAPRIERWGRFRFCVVGSLLAAARSDQTLKREFEELAGREWKHPVTGNPLRLGVSTIERWYYGAVRAKSDPVKALGRKRRKDLGRTRHFGERLRALLLAQYREHPGWSVRLHLDNLVALNDPELLPLPSYPTLRRFMRAQGLNKRRRMGPPASPGAAKAQERFEAREVRGYEREYVNALWHCDFHHGSRKILTVDGVWVHPLVLGVLDDRSRLACHVQWYLTENAEDFVHGLCQAFEKRGLPRELMSDNGSAMISAEVQEGLARLSVVHSTTLPYSPYQNGKQESFWGQVEGRLLAMLETEPTLTLAGLNQATQAWVEMEYNRKVHSELAQTPLERFVKDRDVGRRCPPTHELALAFTRQITRRQRRSDGTISIEGVRFEVPSRYGHLPTVTVRVALWNLREAHLCDPVSGQALCRLFPQDKARNADGQRRSRQSPCAPDAATAAPPSTGMAPLLRKLIADYAATGLPPAYIPKTEPSTTEESQP